MSKPKRKVHREICSLCHEVSRVGFHVPDEVWKLSVHVSQQNNLICLRCFTRLADERGVRWDDDIKFYPVSQFAKLVEEAAGEIPDDWMDDSKFDKPDKEGK